MLAWQPPEVVDAVFSGPLVRMTERSVDCLEVLHGQLGAVRRRNGIAFERGECVPGADCIAVAVRDSNGPIGAVSLVAPSGTPLEQFTPLVVDAVRRMSLDLFGISPSARTARREARRDAWSSGSDLVEGVG
jgi:DNA-binding IclR family transcriptional regulator